MSQLRTRNTSELIARGGLIALTTALLAWNWQIATIAPDLSPILSAEPPTAATSTNLATVAQVEPIEVSAFPETLARTLFEPTRRPRIATATVPESQAEAPAAVTAPKADIDPATARIETVKLLGIVLDGDTPARALLRLEGAAEADWVEAGSAINGWQVVTIDSDHVVVEAGGERHEIRLFDYR